MLAGPVAYMREGGGAEGGDDTWSAVYGFLKAKGVVLLFLQQVNSGRCPAFAQRCFLSFCY